MQSSPDPSTAPGGGVLQLGTLLKRLEAATSRLEDIALAQQSQGVVTAQLPAGIANGSSSATSAAVNGSSSSIPSPPQAPAAVAAAPTASAEAQDTPAVQAYRELITGPLAKYVTASQDLGDLVAQQANLVSVLFEAQLAFIKAASLCKKIGMSDPSFMPLLKATQEALTPVADLKDKNRGSKQFNHLATVSEGISAIGWVTYQTKPASCVDEGKNSAQFWANRITKEFKTTEPRQVEWASTYMSLLTELANYVRAHHLTGLTWNPKGQEVSAYLRATPTGAPAAPAPPNTPSAPSAPSAPAPPAGVPPAPPSAAAPSSKPKAAAGDLSAVFSDLNKGTDVTKGLRKVDKSEMTHKNPSLRASSAVPDKGDGSSSSTPPSIAKKPTVTSKKPPRKELDGQKWTVENYENDRQIVVEGTEISHTINIFSCTNSVIQVKGKVNAISLVGCSKTSVLLDSTVSALSLTNCPSFTVQILGVVPTILIDATDGGQVYLSKESLGVEIITSKTSGLNVSLPKQGGDEGEYVERPVPEQMKTTVSADGKLKTEIVEHSG